MKLRLKKNEVPYAAHYLHSRVDGGTRAVYTSLVHDMQEDGTGRIASTFVANQLEQEKKDGTRVRVSEGFDKTVLLGQELAYQKVFKLAKSRVVVPSPMLRYRNGTCDGYYIGRGGQYGCNNMLCPACYARFLKNTHHKISLVKGRDHAVYVFGVELPVVYTKVEQDLKYARDVMANFFRQVREWSNSLIRVSHVSYRAVYGPEGVCRAPHTAHTYICSTTPLAGKQLERYLNRNYSKGLTELKRYDSLLDGVYLSDTFKYPTDILSEDNSEILHEILHPLQLIKPHGWRV